MLVSYLNLGDHYNSLDCRAAVIRTFGDELLREGNQLRRLRIDQSFG